MQITHSKTWPQLAIIELPLSKSISNRYAVLEKLSNGKIQVVAHSQSDDTKQILKALSSANKVIDIQHAGTAMRFLTAYFAIQNSKEVVLTGSERMKQRPIGDLVTALQHLGAEINYLEQQSLPPLHIKGKTPSVFQCSIKADISSQFLSALCLIGGFLGHPLTIKINGKVVSSPYLKMTLEILKNAGIENNFVKNTITISPYKSKEIKVNIERDWSAAAAFYALASFSSKTAILLKDLRLESLQGDAICSSIFQYFGVLSAQEKDGIVIKKEGVTILPDKWQVIEYPDLAQSLIVCLALHKKSATISGIQTLTYKETDRIKALTNELAKIGVYLEHNKLDNSVFLDSSGLNFPVNLHINTYNDHRMAFAFSPLALFVEEFSIEQPEVVNKSFPGFWNAMSKLNFHIKK